MKDLTLIMSESRLHLLHSVEEMNWVRDTARREEREIERER